RLRCRTPGWPCGGRLPEQGETDDGCPPGSEGGVEQGLEPARVGGQPLQQARVQALVDGAQRVGRLDGTEALVGVDGAAPLAEMPPWAVPRILDLVDQSQRELLHDGALPAQADQVTRRLGDLPQSPRGDTR